MKRLLAFAAVMAFALTVASSAWADARVTGQTYVRHDGGTDTGIQHCNNTGTNPAPDNDTTDADSDSNDGGSRRQGNEPYSVIDPTNPAAIFAGWNDYCLSDLAAGWQGFAFSLDGGTTWLNSMVPGYPQDTSLEGRASPLYGTHSDAGDPIAAFDKQGNLFVGGIAFNRVQPQNGDVYVATYDTTPHPSGYPVDYLRTRIVARGTPSSPNGGIFQDKPMLEVDRTSSPYAGNVYVCWARFTGFGQNKIFFSRSTDKGNTFSKPISISGANDIHSVQGCDIAVEADGDVYVTFRTFNDNASKTTNALGVARSTDGGNSFTNAEKIRDIVPYFPFDGSRNCGDGPFHCPADFVFHRVPLEARVTSDPTGQLPGVWLVYNEIRPGSIEPSVTSYSSAGSGRVGQSLTYVIRSIDNGQTWSNPVAVDPNLRGHQFFPDIDALSGRLGVVWQDNRTDPAYTVQFPIGNVLFGNRAFSSAYFATPYGNIVNSFFAKLASSSVLGFTFAASEKVSTQGHQSQYEMFGSRQTPFHGDYNWIQMATLPPSLGLGTVYAYMTWTDNRDVVPGVDPRETQSDPNPSFIDGFDVQQCRTDLGTVAQGLGSADIPLARRDAPFTGDTCGNAGGLDQNIYGAGKLIP